MKYFLVIENNEYTIIKVKPENLEDFRKNEKRPLLLEANSLFELLSQFETEITHNSSLQLNQETTS